MQASLFLILQNVTYAIPCPDHDSLIGMSSMSDGGRISDEIVEFTFDDKIADVSHKYFQVPSRCNRIEINERFAAGITLNMPLLGHFHGC